MSSNIGIPVRTLSALIFVFFIATVNSQERLLWSFQTEGRVYSTPLIIGSKLYFGSGDSTLYALNTQDGSELWTFNTRGAIHSSPVNHLNMVIFGSADGHLYALDKDDGSLIWRMASEGEQMYDMWDYYLSSPTVDKGIVYWGCGDGHFYAVDVNDGNVIWKYNSGDIIHASPIVYGGWVLVGGFDGYFYAFNKKSGEILWKFKTVGATYFPKGEVQRGALVRNGVVYFGSRDYNIYALDVKTGRGHWNMKQPRGWIIATPIEYKGGIYFGTSDDHSFYCLDKMTGAVNPLPCVVMVLLSIMMMLCISGHLMERYWVSIMKPEKRSGNFRPWQAGTSGAKFLIPMVNFAMISNFMA